jgi:hypothetical protein
MTRRSNDPIKTGARKAKAQRQVGQGAFCVDCGDAEKLVKRSRPKRCVTCYAAQRGDKKTEGHHIGGKANSPLTVEVPIADHQLLSEAQYEWAPGTLQNPDGSPLIALAGSLRGVADFIGELITAFLHRLASYAEDIDTWLREQYGRWWEGGPFDGWQPR